MLSSQIYKSKNSSGLCLDPMSHPCTKNILAIPTNFGKNIVCTCCGCISHDITEFDIVLHSYDPLCHLRIPENANILFDFSCCINILDQYSRSESCSYQQAWNHARQVYSFMSCMSQSTL